MLDYRLPLIVLVLNVAVFLILLLIAICIIRTGVLWAMKDFDKWKRRNTIYYGAPADPAHEEARRRAALLNQRDH